MQRPDHREAGRHPQPLESRQPQQPRVRPPPRRWAIRVSAGPERKRPHEQGCRHIEQQRGSQHERRPDFTADDEQSESDDDQHDCGDPGEQKILLAGSRSGRPKRQKGGSVRERADRRAELSNVAEASREAERLVCVPILEQYRNERQRCDYPRGENVEARSRVSTPVDEPHQPRHDQCRQKQHEVTVRERLKQPGCTEQREPRSAAPRLSQGSGAAGGCGQILMESEQHQGHPLGRQHLKVGELSGAVRREGERQAGAPAGRVRSREPEREQIGEEPRQRERQQHCHVVADDWCRAGPLHRSGEDADPQQVLGKRHRVLHRKQKWRVPPTFGQRDGVGVPPENPRVEDGVAGVAGNVGGEVPCQRPRCEDRQQDEKEEDDDRG